MRWTVVILAVVISLAVVAGPTAETTAVFPATHPENPDLTALVTDASPLPTGPVPRALPSSTSILLTLTLSNPHSPELDRFLAAVEDPASPDYRHFLSFSQYVQAFAPPDSTVASVDATLAGMGAKDLSAAPDRSSVSAILPAGSVQELLGVHLVSYGSEGRMPLYTAVGTATLPSSLSGLVSGVDGLSDAPTAELAARPATLSEASRPLAVGSPQFVYDPVGEDDWFFGSDYTQAYGATSLFPGAHSVANATYPTSVAIATLLGSGWNETNATNLPPWDPAVVDAYFNGTLGPQWPRPNLTGVPVPIAGVTPPLPGSFGTMNDSLEFEFENSLDLEMAGSLAPGASLYNFYFAGSLVAGSATNGDAADYLADDLSAALAYSYAPAHLATVSCSFGLPDETNTFWNAELDTAAALGVTVVSASGDQADAPNSVSGRGDGQWPLWPATAATNTSGSVAVGGVSLGLSGTSTSTANETSVNLSYDPNAGTILSQVAWYDTTGGQGSYAGTEGGASTVVPEPYWQNHSAAQPAIVNATVQQGATALGRSEPDVAMPGNSTIATVFANGTGTIFLVILEGTSVAAPVLAGLLADVVAVENNGSRGPWTSLGFIDPEIYRFASYFAAHPRTSGDPFLDVTHGSNYVFTAASGWDALTGWGGVVAPAFLAADENSTLQQFKYTGPTPGLPPPSPSAGSGPVPWVLIFTVFGAGILAVVVVIVLTARSSRRAPRTPVVPWGAQSGGRGSHEGPPPGTYPGATFLCPYCGTVRPAEAGRCPQCGAY